MAQTITVERADNTIQAYADHMRTRDDYRKLGEEMLIIAARSQFSGDKFGQFMTAAMLGDMGAAIQQFNLNAASFLIMGYLMGKEDAEIAALEKLAAAE
jgi:hypothetical protein